MLIFVEEKVLLVLVISLTAKKIQKLSSNISVQIKVFQINEVNWIIIIIAIIIIIIIFISQ